MAETDRERYPGHDARRRFGRTLHLWRLKAGWSQDTLHEWGKAAGFSTVTDAVWNKLEGGKTPQPLPLTFIQLGTANDRLARQEWGTIADLRLRQRVQGQTPILDLNEQPWTAVDFFAHFVGLTPPPCWAEETQAWAISQEDAEKLGAQQREMFIKYAQDNLLDRAEAWGQLQQHCNGMSQEQVEAFKLVLAGHHKWTPAELGAMTDGAGRNATIQALQAWCDKDSLCAEFRDLCPD